MIAVHILMALFAAFRITEALLVDEIFSPLRWLASHWGWTKRFMGCPRCLSFWGGAIALVFYWKLPYLNWPLAFSFLFLYTTRISEYLMPPKEPKREGVFLEIGPAGYRVDWGGLDPQIGIKTMRDLLAQIDATEKKNAEQREAMKLANA